MKCDSVGCNQSTKSPYALTKKCAIGLAGASVAAQGVAYGVASSCLCGFKNRTIADKKEILKSYQDKFGKVTDMSKTTCSKFVKGVLKDLRSAKYLGRVALKSAAVGAAIGLVADAVVKHNEKMDYRRH